MKILFSSLILAVFLVGFSECSLQLKASVRRRLTQTLEAECTSRGVEKVDEIKDKSVIATECFERVFNSSDIFEKTFNNSNEDYLLLMQEVCKYREGLTNCAHLILYSMAPCAPQSVKDQIEDLKSAVVSLFDYVCKDDCAKVRRFIDDGSVKCLKDNGFIIMHCTKNLTDIFDEFPTDIKDFKAIDACHRFDAMKSCLSYAMECPKPSTKEFVDDVLTIFRKGSYCHITVPQPSSYKIEEDNEA